MENDVQIMEKPLVAAVILTFNRRGVVLECIRRLQDASVAPAYTLVVDNGSADDTVGVIRTTYPGAMVNRLEENLGPAGGFAVGMAQASRLDCDWIMVLNDDCFVQNDTLQRLLDVAGSADPRVGIVSPSFRLSDGDHMGYVWKHVPVPVIVSPADPVSGLVDVDLVTFSGVLVRADFVRRFGVPRSDYFMMWEEWEYCLRLRRQGFRVVTVPGCYAEHPGGDSLALPPSREYYQARNYLRTVLCHRDLLDVLFWAGREVKTIGARVLAANQKGLRIRLRLLGIFDAFRGRMGRTIPPRLVV